MFHDIIFIFIIINIFFFWTKKGNGLKLDENRLDEYRSWTKVNWTKTGLDENLWTKTGWTKTGWTKTGRTILELGNTCVIYLEKVTYFVYPKVKD